MRKHFLIIALCLFFIGCTAHDRLFWPLDSQTKNGFVSYQNIMKGRIIIAPSVGDDFSKWDIDGARISNMLAKDFRMRRFRLKVRSGVSLSDDVQKDLLNQVIEEYTTNQNLSVSSMSKLNAKLEERYIVFSTVDKMRRYRTFTCKNNNPEYNGQHREPGDVDESIKDFTYNTVTGSFSVTRETVAAVNFSLHMFDLQQKQLVWSGSKSGASSISRSYTHYKDVSESSELDATPYPKDYPSWYYAIEAAVMHFGFHLPHKITAVPLTEKETA